ncbi:MAG: copper resistance CopC family protein [Sphingomonadales bacterium]
MRSLFIALIISVTFSSIAFAHVRLVYSSPAQGEILDKPPEKIELVLSEQAKITSIEIVKSSGEKFSTSSLPKELVEEVSLTVPELASGSYVINWRGASKDMHAMSGKIEFIIK